MSAAAVVASFAAVAVASALAGVTPAQARPRAVAVDPSAIPVADFFARPERSHFRLSADGHRLAWLGLVADADGVRRANIFVQALSGVRLVGVPRQLTHDLPQGVPDLAWKGSTTLLFRQDRDGDEDVHVVALDVECGALRDLTPGEHVRADLLDALPGDPAHVLVTSHRRDPERADVWRVDLRSGDAAIVAENPGDIVRWMTDHHGRVRLALRGDGLALTWLYRADEGAGWVPLVTTDFRTDVTPKVFAADDRRIVALSNRGRDKAAAVVIDPRAPDVEHVLYAPSAVDAADVAWSDVRRRVERVDFLDDRPGHRFLDPRAAHRWRRLQARLPGRALSLQSADAAEDVVVVAADDDRSAGTRWLWDARRDVLVPLAVLAPRLPAAARARMRPVRYTARDGLAIHGTLTLPPGRGPTRPMACVVHPHGGPWTRDAWGFDPEVQLLASRGWCVLQMDYRGSTGRGRAFWEAGFRQWGRAMQDDVDDGAQWLVAQGIADPRRLAIVGASYGGYVALAAAAFTPGRYAAAVDQSGPVDLPTMLDELPPAARAQLPELAEMIGDPARDDDRARLAAVSPARHVEAIATPLLVVQGANDPRVPTWRVERFVDAVRRRGGELEYLRVDGEGHGLRKEDDRRAVATAMVEFLARHLAPGR